jgi:hypothetical protein
VLEAWREARAVRSLLGAGARVAARRELQRRRSRYSAVLDLADGARCVLKFYRRAPRAAHEALRLGAANALPEVATPRLRGCARHVLIQDFVPGEPLDRLAKRTAGAARAELLARAAVVLAAIHGTKRTARGLPELSESCAPRRLAARLRGAWALVEGVGFARWRALHGELPSHWRGALDAASLDRLAGALGATGEGCVIGHGDYHPRHLVRTAEDQLFVIDWSAMSLVAPWLELAHLLRWLGPEERAGVTSRYLDAAQRRGVLRTLAAARAQELAASALAVDHLLVAKQMVRKLASDPEPGAVAAFRASLDALAERR